MGNPVMPLHEAAAVIEDSTRLLNMLQYQNPRVPLIMAERRDVGEPVLRALAARKRPVVRYRLLKFNADRLPLDVLEQLVTDNNEDVRALADRELSKRRTALAQGGGV